MHNGFFVMASNAEVKAAQEYAAAAEQIRIKVKRAQSDADDLFEHEYLLSEIPKRKARILSLQDEYNSYLHDIQKLNELETEVKVSARLSELLDSTYTSPNNPDKYKSVLLREGSVNGIVAFRNKMEAITELVRDKRKSGFSVGMNGLSYTLEQWYESIKKSPQDALFLSRLLSTHDACVRQYFEPQMVVNYIMRTDPEKEQLFAMCRELSVMKSGSDFEEWRLERSKTIARAYGILDENDKLNKGRNRITRPEDLIGLLPEHSLLSAINHALGSDVRYGFYIHSPLGLSRTLGIEGQKELLNGYSFNLSNVDENFVAKFSVKDNDTKMEM